MQKITNSVDGILGFIKNWGGKVKDDSEISPTRVVKRE
jgi:hypothetical protein